jgi:anti-sigma B factor antagonist
VNVRKGPSGVSIVDVSGEFTVRSEDAVTSAYVEATADDSVQAVLLNFSDLEYLNSGGIGLLVTLLVRANREGVRVLAFGLSEHHRHLFQLTRIDEAIEVHHGEQDAIAAAGSGSG